ncbi:MAG TPA: response regulator, partial [Acidothermaceae bacterium]|nr:response regulator [Acidothermaceae bacterium]
MAAPTHGPTPGQTPGQTPGPAYGPERGTILVVDDDADIRRFVEMNLRLEGYRVVTAADGAMALAMVATDVPDLVLLDVMMPGVDGIEVTRRLRADSRTSTMPIIMLTAKS